MLILVYAHIFKHFERKILAWSSFSRSELYRNISSHNVNSDLFIEFVFYFKTWNTVSLQAIDYATTSENLKFCFYLKFDLCCFMFNSYSILTLWNIRTRISKISRFWPGVSSVHQMLFSSSSSSSGAVCMAPVYLHGTSLVLWADCQAEHSSDKHHFLNNY